MHIANKYVYGDYMMTQKLQLAFMNKRYFSGTHIPSKIRPHIKANTNLESISDISGKVARQIKASRLAISFRFKSNSSGTQYPHVRIKFHSHLDDIQPYECYRARVKTCDQVVKQVMFHMHTCYYTTCHYNNTFNLILLLSNENLICNIKLQVVFELLALLNLCNLNPCFCKNFNLHFLINFVVVHDNLINVNFRCS